MAIAPLTAATKSIKTAGLFDPSKSGGLSFDDWMKKKGGTDAFPSIAPAQVNDSMADKVTALTKVDSPLMQAARTEGLKVANRRGMLNSSIAAGASQAASLAAVLPIASQDSAQDFQRNYAARQFEYGMATQDDAQKFAGDQAGLDRALSERMQGRDIASREKLGFADIGSREKISLAQIASTEGLAEAQRQLDLRMQEIGIGAAEAQQIRDIASREGIAAADRKLQLDMQTAVLSAADRQQLLDIESREGIAAAERALQEKLQNQDIRFRGEQAAADRQMQVHLQEQDIKFRQNLAKLDRNLQKKIAGWNLDASDRNAAVQMVVNMEGIYTNLVQSINANTALSADQRTAQLASARSYRDEMLDFTQQLYDVDLKWNTAPTPSKSDDK